MKFIIKIDCDNAAFEPVPVTEVARILQELVDHLCSYGFDGIAEYQAALKDINGNKVGKAYIQQED